MYINRQKTFKLALIDLSFYLKQIGFYGKTIVWIFWYKYLLNLKYKTQNT